MRPAKTPNATITDLTAGTETVLLHLHLAVRFLLSPTILSVLNSGLHCHCVSDGTVMERSSFRSSLLTSGTSAHSSTHTVLTWGWLACGTCQLRYHVVNGPSIHSLRDWDHVGVVLCELPTASSHFGSTGVLWVLTGTHPCGPPSRMMEVARAPALCGLWSLNAVVKWSCGVIERCGSMSVSQHFPFFLQFLSCFWHDLSVFCPFFFFHFVLFSFLSICKFLIF